MPATVERIPGKILSLMRSKARVLGGKAKLAKVSGVSKPTIKSCIDNGKAIPSVIEKLEKALSPKKTK